MIQQNKELYRNSCIAGLRIPIFHQPSWLDVACGPSNWQVILVMKNDSIEAVFPYATGQRYWMEVSLMPDLTPYLGLCQIEKISSKSIKALQSKIPNYELFSLRNKPGTEGYLDWIWNGWELETKYSLEIPPTQSAALKDLKGTLRNDIKNAASQLTLEPSKDVQTLFSLIEKSFTRKEEAMPFNFELLTAFHEVIQENNWGEIWMAKDIENNVVAGHYFIWDNDRVYNWMSGFEKKNGLRGATQMILYHGIQLAQRANKIFDFEGGSIPGIGNMYKSFPVTEVPYIVSRKFKSKWIKALWSLRQ